MHRLSYFKLGTGVVIKAGRDWRDVGRPLRCNAFAIATFLPCDYAKHIRTVLLSTSVCLSVRLSVKRVYCDKRKAPSEKSSIMTNRKSPTSFPMSLR